MKLSKEIRIALISIATIVAFILLANFLKGSNFLKPEKTYYVYYDDANNLTSSCAVFFKGMKVGRVEKLEFTDPENPRIKVTIVINESLRIPKNTAARITTADLLGSKIVELIFSEEQVFLRNGDELKGEIAVDLVDEISLQLLPIKDKIEHLVTSLGSLATTMNEMFNEQAQRQLQSSIQDLSISLNNVKDLTSKANTLVDEQRENMEQILSDFAKISSELSESNISNTIQKLDSTLTQAETVMKKLNTGEGSASKLLNDQKLYEELTVATTNLNKLLEDLKANPKRYVHFSLFGRK